MDRQKECRTRSRPAGGRKTQNSSSASVKLRCCLSPPPSLVPQFKRPRSALEYARLCHGVWPGEVPPPCKLGARNTACRITSKYRRGIKSLRAITGCRNTCMNIENCACVERQSPHLFARTFQWNGPKILRCVASGALSRSLQHSRSRYLHQRSAVPQATTS